MLIAEDLLLLLTHDATGRFRVSTTYLDPALAGAVLIELAELGRVRLAEDGEQVRKGRVVVADGSPVGDAVLDDALRHVSEGQGKKPEAVLGSLQKGLRPVLLDRLAQAGALRREDTRILGLFPVTRWPAEDSRHKAELLERLDQALVRGLPADPRIGAIVGLLLAVDAVHKVLGLEGRGVSARQVKRRAKEIGTEAWAADATLAAVAAVQAAVVAATMAAVVAATVVGS